MSKYIDADTLKRKIVDTPTKALDGFEFWHGDALNGLVNRQHEILDMIDEMPATDVEPVRRGLIEQVKKYAADMEKLYTEVCADFRERTGQDYVCGACKYNDCAYVGADGDWCGECPGFESDECFVLSDDVKGDIWKIVDIVSGTKTDGGGEE